MRSKAVSAAFLEFDCGPEFSPEPPFLSEHQSKVRTRAGHMVDSILKCSTGEYIAIEVGLNNREAIGTNLMKLAISLENRTPNFDDRLGVLIAPSRELLNYGGWDTAYGDVNEYVEAFDLGYERYLACNFLIIELDV